MISRCFAFHTAFLLAGSLSSIAASLHAVMRSLRVALCGAACAMALFSSKAAEKPNIVYILCDDLGYGDVHCLNSEGKIRTPNMDRLAAAGMTFTDAHSSSSVCTPTRYGILTGRYNWRSRLKRGFQMGSPRLIEPGRLTSECIHGHQQEFLLSKCAACKIFRLLRSEYGQISGFRLGSCIYR